jgi:hypothetical protein
LPTVKDVFDWMWIIFSFFAVCVGLTWKIVYCLFYFTYIGILRYHLSLLLGGDFCILVVIGFASMIIIISYIFFMFFFHLLNSVEMGRLNWMVLGFLVVEIVIDDL